MNRLQSLFERKPQNLLSIYFTAGYPTLDSVGEIITTLVANGIDMIEVGVPFSDPMADGPVIQESSTVALRNGMTLRRLLADVKAVRAQVPDTPLVLMGYVNPMMRMGIRNLFEAAADAGIDAIIVQDLPFDIYLSEFRDLCREFDIPMIMLITPETSEERIHLIDEHCDGFIYMVSSAATTGTRDSFGPAQLDYFRRINAMKLNHKRLIGFGISNAHTLADAQANASGAIIGSKFIKSLAANPTDIPAAVKSLLHALSE